MTFFINILLIVYFISLSIAIFAGYMNIKSDLKRGLSIYWNEIGLLFFACVIPILNTYAVYQWLNDRYDLENKVAIKGKKNESETDSIHN